MAPRRRKDLAAIRRRVEDEGDEEGGSAAGDLDNDSLSEGSIITVDDAHADDDGVSDGDAVSAVSPELLKVNRDEQQSGKANGTNGVTQSSLNALTNGTSDMELMLNGLNLPDQKSSAEVLHYGDLQEDEDLQEPSPAVVNSTAHMDRSQELPHERRRREHEEYKKKRDADPAFVPNRGAFFMHDHRHAGPAANGFRPFGRGRGRGRPGIGGPYAPIKYVTALNHVEISYTNSPQPNATTVGTYQRTMGTRYARSDNAAKPPKHSGIKLSSCSCKNTC
jgi:hypothetical protein